MAKRLMDSSPRGFKGAYERVAKDPASAQVLSDILSLVGFDVAPEVVELWPLEKRVEAEVWACREHAVASDNPLRRHPKPEWLPEPWQGPDRGGVWGPAPTRVEA